MKARDYADMFNAEPDFKEAISKIGTRFVHETHDIIERRKAKSPSAGMAVIKEQSDKWKAFARRVEGVKEDGYLIIMREVFPEIALYL